MIYLNLKFMSFKFFRFNLICLAMTPGRYGQAFFFLQEGEVFMGKFRRILRRGSLAAVLTCSPLAALAAEDEPGRYSSVDTIWILLGAALVSSSCSLVLPCWKRA